MALETFIQHYGYAAVLVGTFLEGETVLVLAGFAAHRGYLVFPWVLLAAFFGTLTGDQLYFLLGRRYSAVLLRRHPAWSARTERARQRIKRHRRSVILGFRFLYGLRTITPFALGMSDVPFGQFLLLNALGGMVWTVIVGGAGYLFGQALELFLGDLRRYEAVIFVTMAAAGLLLWLVRFLRDNSTKPGAAPIRLKSLLSIPKPFLLAACAVLVLCFGGVDLLTGAEFSTEMLYLIPIFIATRLTGRWGGGFIALLSSLAWLAADIGAGTVYSHPAVPYWNVLVRLFSFLVITYLFAELMLARRRRRDLESIFFHDISNVVGTIRGAAELLLDSEAVDRKTLYGLILGAADQAADEIASQRTLSAIENRELEVHSTPISSRLLLEQVVKWYRHHALGRDRAIELDPASEDILFESDPALISRVLGNMVKNALEAAGPGGTISAGSAADRGGVEFRVHNSGIIPPEVQKTIFQRSVSAKGRGRGLGTYSMRVLSERIGGRVSFTSSAWEGTTFCAWYPLKTPSR